MTLPITNPYSGAWYYGYFDTIDSGPIPLQPCAGAYSVGPSSDDTDLSVGWISYGFNFVSSTFLSCNLIKDENDIFYYAVYSTGVRINEYNAPSGTSTTYNPSTPAELTAFLGANSSPHWMIRKASATVLDLVVSGFTDSGATRNFEHYIWTIGAATMTYVDGFSHTLASADYEGNLCAGIHGPLVIDGYVDGQVYYLQTYNLDDQAKETIEVFDRTGKQSSCVGFYYGGAKFHAVAMSAEVTATGECQEIDPAGVRTVNQASQLDLSGFYLDENGTSHAVSKIIDSVQGHDCYFSDVVFSGADYIGINPSSGLVYIFCSYQKAWSPTACPEDPYVDSLPGIPELTKTVSGVFGFGEVPGWVDRNESDESPIPAGSGHTVGPGRFNLPSRDAPASLSDDDADGLPNIVYWPDLAEGAEDVFTPAVYGGAIGKQVSDGGQRNDNYPISLSTHYQGGAPFSYWHNVVKDLGGNTYLDQTSDLSGGATTNYLPVTGYMGKWPVRFYIGRWAVFGPNTVVETLGPRWQVV